jgi:regulatory protein
MSDAAEHIAPVSYLPWAKPGDDQGDRRVGAAAASTDAEQAGTSLNERSDASEAPGSTSRGSSGWERAGRSGATSRTTGGRSFGRNGWSSSAPVRAGVESVDPEGEIDDDAAAETGPERDDRIDRIIVSRLRRSALSVSEVRSTLVEHGLDHDEVEEWIERYERFGYLDDARLAEQLVHASAGRRGKGSGAVIQELTRRGIGAEAARAAIEGLDPEAELENARTVAERRVRQLRGLERQVAERRLSAFLQRRGYAGDVVRQVVAEVLATDGS